MTSVINYNVTWNFQSLLTFVRCLCLSLSLRHTLSILPFINSLLLFSSCRRFCLLQFITSLISLFGTRYRCFCLFIGPTPLCHPVSLLLIVTSLIFCHTVSLHLINTSLIYLSLSQRVCLLRHNFISHCFCFYCRFCFHCRSLFRAYYM